jgi:putative transposase
MCLQFVFLLITRVVAWLQLSRREEAWRITEILILRHQLALLKRQQPSRPKLNWADRALLAILLGVIPRARRHGLRMLVTPDTILRSLMDLSLKVAGEGGHVAVCNQRLRTFNLARLR